jgi:hypothetical protein
MIAASLLATGVSIPLSNPVYAANLENKRPDLSRWNGDGISRVKATSAMKRCLATWDRSSQMSKQEWKKTCKRVVRENPGLYDKPF